MAFVLIIIGLVLLVASIRNTQSQLYTLIGGDFTGQNNFIFWLVALLAIGALGYIPRFKPLSTAFLALVIIVLFLRKGVGFFSQFTSAITTTESTSVSASGSSVNPITSLFGASGQGSTPGVLNTGTTGSPLQLPSLTNILTTF